MAEVGRPADGLRGCPGFGSFWAAATVSSFGTYVTTLAIQVLVVLTLRGGAADVGLVSAARWLPYLLFGVVAGVFVDRARRRPVLVATDIVRCVLLTAIPTLAVTKHLSLKRALMPRSAQL
jgi:MFS family permease